MIAGDPDSQLWLVRETTSGVFHYTQRYFEEKNIHGKKLLVKSNEVIVALLKEGVGRSILSKRAVPPEVPTEKLAYHRNFYLIQRTNLVSENLQAIGKEILRSIMNAIKNDSSERLYLISMMGLTEEQQGR